MSRHYPRRLGPGGEERVGEAVVRLGEDGRLEACDPYGCVRARLPRGHWALLEPVPAVSRPAPLTGCIYVELEEPLVHPGGASTVWTLAPYEILVTASGAQVARLTPTRAKYTLVGDVVDGLLCRYSRGPLAFSPEEALEAREPGYAVLAVRITGSPAVVPGIAFPAAQLPIYTDEEARLYYPLVEARVEEPGLTVKPTGHPPLAGLEVAQRGRRGLILQPSLQQPLQR